MTRVRLSVRKRGHISLKEKLAAALAQMLRDDGAGKLVPVIPWDDAKQMTADQVLSLWAWDHYPRRHVDGGPDVHWNLVPRFIGEHREKTAKIDIPEIAKGDRIRDRLAEFNARMAAKDAGDPRPQRSARKIPSRPFPQKRARV